MAGAVVLLSPFEFVYFYAFQLQSYQIIFWIVLFSATSVATQSDDESLATGPGKLGLNRLHLSKDLQDVYDTLMHFQKKDSSQSYTMPKLELPQTPKSDPGGGSYDDRDNLSELMAAYGVLPSSGRSHVVQAVVTPQQPAQPQTQGSGYFIPVDFETYSKWMATRNDKMMEQPMQSQQKQKSDDTGKKPPAKKAKAPKQVNPVDEDADGEDTSQDAADLISQESTKEHVIAQVVIGHPDQKLVKPAVVVDLMSSEPKKDTGPSEEEERDENFVIESDDIDAKLYSSESDSPAEPQQPPPPEVTTKAKLKLEHVSLSSSSSDDKPKKAVVKKPPAVLTLQLQSETDSEPPQKPSVAVINEDDVSGPEMDNDEDFWN